eukprot:CAMPEP_0183785380 /NCGR_PEP_ID=MMETSP0739-20130205/66475_1 /TAXON_ID=385413 /ORGANISM="Thalassiosira miniscula, Strain CCMP1093" /LENGTH=695 /DNA_ID=CAMNT_0026029383 /DNA_START=248 /DNA_END=2332 /DNA_ORIENTATION=-
MLVQGGRGRDRLADEDEPKGRFEIETPIYDKEDAATSSMSSLTSSLSLSSSSASRSASMTASQDGTPTELSNEDNHGPSPPPKYRAESPLSISKATLHKTSALGLRTNLRDIDTFLDIIVEDAISTVDSLKKDRGNKKDDHSLELPGTNNSLSFDKPVEEVSTGAANIAINGEQTHRQRFLLGAPGLDQSVPNRSVKFDISSSSVHSFPNGASNQSASNHCTDDASIVNSDSMPKSILRPAKYTTMIRRNLHYDDSASSISQGSTSSVKSAYKKLKDFMNNKLRPKGDASRKQNDRDFVSGIRTSKYRRNNSSGSSSATSSSSESSGINRVRSPSPAISATTQSSSSEHENVARPQSTFSFSSSDESDSSDPNEVAAQSFYSSVHSSIVYSKSVCSSIVSNEDSEKWPSSACSTMYNGSVDLARRRNLRSDKYGTHKIDPPWVGNNSSGRRENPGEECNGPVIGKANGKGTWVLDGKALHGCKANGELVTSAIDRDKAMDQGRQHSDDLNNMNFHKKHKECEDNKVLRTKPYEEYRMKHPVESEMEPSESPSFNAINLWKSEDNQHSSSKEEAPLKSSINTSDEISEPPTCKYTLGEKARSTRDMVICSSRDEAIHSASLLEKKELAFLKRSNGEWSCAILADRSLQPISAAGSRARWHAEDDFTAAVNSANCEECMLFVINTDGATKIIKKKHW